MLFLTQFPYPSTKKASNNDGGYETKDKDPIEGFDIIIDDWTTLAQFTQAFCDKSDGIAEQAAEK